MTQYALYAIRLNGRRFVRYFNDYDEATDACRQLTRHGGLADHPRADSAEVWAHNVPIFSVYKDGGRMHEAYRTKTGKAVSDDDLEELAEEADRGYDVAALRDLPMRPRGGVS